MQGLERRVVAEERRKPDQENEADRHQDEEIADLQDRALEVRHRLRLLDEVGSLAEIGVHAGRGDKAGHLALLGDRPRIGVVADCLVHRQRFPGQRRLIDAEVVAPDELHVGRNDVAEADRNDVAGHEEPRLDVLPNAVALDARFQGQPLLQERDRVVGLELLPEANARVDEQHEENDRKIVPMTKQSGEHGRDLDHPGDRAPEEMGQALQHAYVMLGERILAILREPPLSFGLGEAGRLRCGR